MKNKDLQNFLSQFPDELPLKIQISGKLLDFTDENILHTSETAYIDRDEDEEDWDAEDGKVELGDVQQFLLFNPIII